MTERAPKSLRASDEHGVAREINLCAAGLACVEHMVLTGVPARWWVWESLLLSTIGGEKLGFIGHGKKVGRFRFGKLRDIQFDILTAEQLPIYRICRSGDGRYSNARVLPPLGNDNPVGEIAIRSYTYQSMQFRISYTLYEIQADGMYREPFATVESDRFATEYRFTRKGNTIASMNWINEVQIGLRTSAPNYLLWLDNIRDSMPICVPNLGRYQPHEEAQSKLTANERAIVLAAAFLLHCTWSDLTGQMISNKTHDFLNHSEHG